MTDYRAVDPWVQERRSAAADYLRRFARSDATLEEAYACALLELAGSKDEPKVHEAAVILDLGRGTNGARP